METQKQTQGRKDPYTVWIGCYGGTRGTTIGKLADTFLRYELGDNYENEVKIHCGGHPKFMDGKVDKPISAGNLEALATIASSGQDLEVINRVTNDVTGILQSTGRKMVTSDLLQKCDAVYSADSFIRDMYGDLAGQKGDEKYKTVLQGIGEYHRCHGVDMDDTEASVDFTKKVIVNKKQGKPIVGSGNPKDYDYFNLAGQRFRAGDKEALVAAAGDMVYIAYKLSKKIASDVALRRQK